MNVRKVLSLALILLLTFTLAVPAFAARLVYSLSLGETLSATVARMVPGPEGHAASVLPEMYFLLTELGAPAPSS